MAIEQRDAVRGTVIHSDHGSPWTFSERARQSGLVPSMASIGDCYDCEQNRGRCSLSV